MIEGEFATFQDREDAVGTARWRTLEESGMNDGPKGIFAVIRTRGLAWDPVLPMEQQADWREHADFMTALAEDGFVALVGPLEGTADVLLIARASDAEEVRSRLAGDCWERSRLLRTTRIDPWTLRLGTLGGRPAPSPRNGEGAATV
jgi:hypothetical protein